MHADAAGTGSEIPAMLTVPLPRYTEAAQVGKWLVCPVSTGWQVITPGGTQATSVRATVGEAVQRACLMAADEGGGQVIVHDQQGSPEHTYPVQGSVQPFRSR